jgi:hypothetical protein
MKNDCIYNFEDTKVQGWENTDDEHVL